MKQDRRTIEEIQALLGTVPEMQLPQRVDDVVLANALNWARERQAVQERLQVPLYGRIALAIGALQLCALLFAGGERLDIDQFMRAFVSGLVGLNIVSLLVSPIVLLYRQRRERFHE